MYVIQDEAAEAARNAGGNIVGGDELIKQVHLHAINTFGGLFNAHRTCITKFIIFLNFLVFISD